MASFRAGWTPAKIGVFAPPALIGPLPFAELQVMISDAETGAGHRASILDQFNSCSGEGKSYDDPLMRLHQLLIDDRAAAT